MYNKLILLGCLLKLDFFFLKKKGIVLKLIVNVKYVLIYVYIFKIEYLIKVLEKNGLWNLIDYF